MLTQAGANTVGDLQAWPWAQLLGVVGGQRKLAGRLWEWCWGRDTAPVADKGPPKSIQVRGQGLQGAAKGWASATRGRQEGAEGLLWVTWFLFGAPCSSSCGGGTDGFGCVAAAGLATMTHQHIHLPCCILPDLCACTCMLIWLQVQMSLTPQLMPVPPSVAGRPPVGQAPAAAGSGGASRQPMVLQPLCCASPDTMLRLRQVMGAMLADLLSRVLLDRWATGILGVCAGQGADEQE